MTTNNVHIVTYPVLGLLLGGSLYLWHDTRVNDAAQAAILQRQVADTAQVLKEAEAAISERDKAAAAKDAQIQEQVTALKTAQQQAAYLTQAISAKTPIIVQTPAQAVNPSLPDAPKTQDLVIPDSERTSLMQFVGTCQKCQNDLAKDDADVIDLKKESVAKDLVIKDQAAEIKKLKGGHMKRFLGAGKDVLIGIAVGYAANKLAGH